MHRTQAHRPKAYDAAFMLLEHSADPALRIARSGQISACFQNNAEDTGEDFAWPVKETKTKKRRKKY